MRDTSAPRRMVKRRRLFEALSAGTDTGVTLVCAPPGSGKTDLLRTWAADIGPRSRIAWISVERGEQDPQRFWCAVIDRLGAAAGEKKIAEIGSPSPGVRGDQLVERLIAGLEALREPVVLVIDDLHELRSRDALAQLETLLSSAPERLRIVLATRRDPPLGLHRLRLVGKLTELREAELRFTPAEGRALLHAVGVRLSDRAFSVLYARTEGWAAGLRLAAISLVAHSDPDRFVDDFSGTARTVADYLLAEVLDAQSDAVRRLLVRTSVLERVCGELADALTESSGSEGILQGLEDAGAFVTAIDPDRRWFRYHHLFADLLRLELRRTEGGIEPSLHAVAARWHAEQGGVVEAIRHAQAAGEWQLAARLLSEHHHSLALNGEGATAHLLLDGFPDEASGTDADLALVMALDHLLRGSPDTAAEQLLIGERLVAELPPERLRGAETRLAVVRLSLARRRGDIGGVLAMAGSFDELEASDTPTDIRLSKDARGLALMQLGAAALAAWHLEEAERHLLDGVELARQIRRPYLEVGCLGFLGIVGIERSPKRAHAHAHAAVELADSKGWATDPITAPGLLALGATHVWAAEFDAAEEWLRRAERAVISAAEPILGQLLHHGYALLCTGQGRLAEAAHEFLAGRQLQKHLADPTTLAVTFRSTALEVVTLARRQHPDEARMVLNAIPAMHHRHAEYAIAEARVQLAEDAPQQALSTLAPVLDGWLPPLNQVALIEGCLFAAAAQVELGAERTAQKLLERSLALAEPSGAVLPFVVNQDLAHIERHPRHETSHAAFLSRVLDALSGSAAPRADYEMEADTLSPRELRILGHLASNLTAPEIANELYVSPNTVKTHVRHIYAKLNVHNRAGAVDRARELGLFAPRRRAGGSDDLSKPTAS